MAQKFTEKVDEIHTRLGELRVRPIHVVTLPKDPTYSIPPNTLAYELEKISDVVTVLSVTIHWPPGCEGLVDVRIEIGGMKALPVGEGEWLSKDDTTITYTINKSYIAPLGTIVVYWRNRDTSYSHRVPVDIAYMRRE